LQTKLWVLLQICNKQQQFLLAKEIDNILWNIYIYIYMMAGCQVGQGASMLINFYFQHIINSKLYDLLLPV